MKRRLLIAWGGGYQFSDTIVPIIPQLAQEFEVYVLVVDYYVSKQSLEILDGLTSKDLIKRYWIIPGYENVFEQYRFFKSHLSAFRSYGFHAFLSGDEVQIFGRYFHECVLTRQCVRVCFWPTITYLFEHPRLVEGLLHTGNIEEAWGQADIGRPDGRIRRSDFKEKLARLVSSKDFLKKASARIRNHLVNMLIMYRKRLKRLEARVILPAILFGKTFRPGPHDQLTQLGSGRSDAFIFCDEIEAKAHSLLFHTPNVYVARHPAYGSCRCTNIRRNNRALLSPLSGFVGQDSISQGHLFDFYRDIHAVLKETGAQVVHLRNHPRESGRWPYQLRDYLRSRGIGAEVVSSDHPIRHVACDYIATAGFASGALRDARASCDFSVVVGFTSVSKYRYLEPKFAYGESEGIGWIQDDGSYDPDIFKLRKHVPGAKKGVSDIVAELVDAKLGTMIPYACTSMRPVKGGRS